MLFPSKLCGFEDAQYTNKSVSDQLLFYLHLTDCHRFGKRIINYHTEENTEQTNIICTLVYNVSSNYDWFSNRKAELSLKFVNKNSRMLCYFWLLKL